MYVRVYCYDYGNALEVADKLSELGIKYDRPDLNNIVFPADALDGLEEGKVQELAEFLEKIGAEVQVMPFPLPF